MLFSFALGAFVAIQLAAEPAPTAPRQSRSYVLWVSAHQKDCTYWLTDAGMGEKQLKNALRTSYDPTYGLEVLTNPDTPHRCVTKAQRAAKEAGFTSVRVRPGTEKDRSLGIP